jgi:hypothetical protein
MNDEFFEKQFQGLLEKYAELLTGDESPEMVEKIKIWATYQHISRTMPPLTKHWGDMHPDGRLFLRELFEEVKRLNEQLKATRGGENI